MTNFKNGSLSFLVVILLSLAMCSNVAGQKTQQNDETANLVLTVLQDRHEPNAATATGEIPLLANLPVLSGLAGSGFGNWKIVLKTEPEIKALLDSGVSYFVVEKLTTKGRKGSVKISYVQSYRETSSSNSWQYECNMNNRKWHCKLTGLSATDS